MEAVLTAWLFFVLVLLVLGSFNFRCPLRIFGMDRLVLSFGPFLIFSGQQKVQRQVQDFYVSGKPMLVITHTNAKEVGLCPKLPTVISEFYNMRTAKVVPRCCRGAEPDPPDDRAGQASAARETLRRFNCPLICN